MSRKKVFSTALSVLFSCQLLLAPMAMADTASDVVNKLNNDNKYSEYLSLKDKLTDTGEVSSDQVDSFVRDVVNNLDGKEINATNVMDAATDAIMDTKNKDVYKGVISSFSPADVTNAMNGQLPSSMESFGRLFKEALSDTSSTPSGAAGGGGGGGLISSDKFKVEYSGGRVFVKSQNKDYISLSKEQVNEIIKNKKPVDLEFDKAKLTFSIAALNLEGLTGQEDAKLEVVFKEIANTKDNAVSNQTSEQIGNIYEINITVYDKDNSSLQVKELKGTVTVALPIQNDELENGAFSKVSSLWLNEKTSKWENLAGNYNTSARQFSLEIKQPGKFALLKEKAMPVPMETTLGPSFNDIAAHWAKTEIEYMAAKGYVKGTGEGVFSPNAKITRAEFAAMLVNVLEVKEPGQINFKDVSNNAWYFDSVAKAYNANLVKGKSSELFAPQAQITRQEMAAMISNALKYKGIQSNVDTSILSNFADNALISDWAKTSAAQVIRANIIKGKPGADTVNFAPLDLATRAEAAVMLKKFLDIK